MIDNWKNDYVIPYIEELPSKEVDVINYTVGVDISEDELIITKDNDLTPVSVFFEENGDLKTTTGVGSEFGDVKAPKLVYKELENSVEKGMFVEKIIFPKNKM